MDFKTSLIAKGLMRALPSEEVRYDLAGTSRSLAGLDAMSVELFADEMDASINNMHPGVKELIVRKADAVLDLLRIVAKETKAGYGGFTGSGSTLDFTVGWAYDFLDPDISGTVYRKSWRRYISTVSTPGTSTAYITGTSGSKADLEMAEEDGMVFLGFVERADIEPKASALEVIYNSDTYNYQPFSFHLAEKKESMAGSMLLYELKQHILIPPEQKIQLNVRYDDVGIDYLQPVSVRFRRASDMRDL